VVPVRIWACWIVSLHIRKSRSSRRLVGVVCRWPPRGASACAAVRRLRITHGAPATGTSRPGAGDVGPSCPKRPGAAPNATTRSGINAYAQVRAGTPRPVSSTESRPRRSGIEQRFPKPSTVLVACVDDLDVLGNGCCAGYVDGLHVCSIDGRVSSKRRIAAPAAAAFRVGRSPRLAGDNLCAAGRLLSASVGDGCRPRPAPRSLDPA